jgi:iron complex outermembrane receptor protein
MRKIAAIFLVFVSFTSSTYSDEPRKLEKIIVTSSRLGTTLDRNSRSVTVLGPESLSYSSYNAIADQIGNVGGIDIRRRGPEGVQADINIRGSTFEQNTILIDGIKVNDPQTGHFNLDLPLTGADLDSIEILKGPASSLYGPNAFGGVINVITKRPEGKSVKLYSDGGSFDYYRGGLSVTYPFAALGNRFSFEESRSTGYMPETEFNILSLSNTTSIDTFLGIYNFLFGYLKKDFGADSFYSNLFSNEAEHTDTRFFKIGGEYENGPLKVMPKIFLRRHWDKFALDINRPGWQTNYHTTYSYGGQIDCVIKNDFLDTSYGFELSGDSIDSTNLQTHSRTTDGMYLELAPKINDRLDIKAGVREDYFSEFGWQCSPSVSASYAAFKGLLLRGSIGRAYRTPAFTDLYYNDSANRGNSNLRPESSWTYEVGSNCRAGAFDCSLNLFHRDSEDTIDWIRPNTQTVWQATNIGEVSTNGLEIYFELTPKNISADLPFGKTSISYTALDSYKKHDYLSKYALDYLKQQLSCASEFEIAGWRNQWVFNYKKRVGSAAYLTVDTKLSKDIVRKGNLVFEAFIEAANLFDVDYSEQSNIPMPGRWIKSGARVEF